MRLDAEDAFQIIKQANPIPDPAKYASLRRDSLTSQVLAEKADPMRTIEAVPPKELRSRPHSSVPVSVVLVTVASIALAGFVMTLDGDTATAPFDDPQQAIRALVAAGPDTDLGNLFNPRASVDAYGHTRVWDAPSLLRSAQFFAGLDATEVVEACWRDAQRGTCRVLVTDNLLAAAGLERVPQEWSATLDDRGFIATLRQTMVQGVPETEAADRWFIDFNQWMCRNRPEEGRAALWDPQFRLAEMERPDCSAARWTWMIDAGADPFTTLRLHEEYLADTTGR